MKIFCAFCQAARANQCQLTPALTHKRERRNRSNQKGKLPVLPSPFQGYWDTFFRRLVHIYIPRNRTPRGRGHRVGRGTPLLVGLTDSRGSHSSLCRTYPRPLCPYYNIGFGICQGGLSLFFKWFVGVPTLDLNQLPIKARLGLYLSLPLD